MKMIINICFIIPIIVFALMAIRFIWIDDWIRVNTCLIILLFFLITAMFIYNNKG